MQIMKQEQEAYFLTADVGTTTIRACLFDGKGKLVASSAQPLIIEISSEEEVTVEINPHKLEKQFHDVVSEVVSQVPSGAKKISMGICTQRNSFICWEKETLRPCHNFVVWNDCRARKKCEEWNKSWIVKGINLVGGLLHSITRRPRYKAARILRFLGSMVSFRLIASIEQNKGLRALLEEGQLAFGCMDTWLMLRLSKGRVLTTEPSSISATGMFDPFLNDYNYTILRLIGFPWKLLTPIRDSASSSKAIVTVEADIFGRPIDIYSVLADQQAALFGCGGWEKGDTVISLGTGTFVQRNLGAVPHASMRGLYPLIGWRINGETTNIAEGNDHDTSLILSWAQSIGLFSDVRETSEIAEKAASSDGVYFVPAFGGLQTPSNDDSACCGFLGLRPSSSKSQMVRALLESIAFRVYEIISTMQSEIRDNPMNKVRICGGISANDFVCQTIATLIDSPVERVTEASFAASRGVALLAGLVQGVWGWEELPKMVEVDRTFQPISNQRDQLVTAFCGWQRAAKRCLRFYQ